MTSTRPGAHALARQLAKDVVAPVVEWRRCRGRGPRGHHARHGITGTSRRRPRRQKRSPPETPAPSHSAADRWLCRLCAACGSARGRRRSRHDQRGRRSICAPPPASPSAGAASTMRPSSPMPGGHRVPSRPPAPLLRGLRRQRAEQPCSHDSSLIAPRPGRVQPLRCRGRRCAPPPHPLARTSIPWRRSSLAHRLPAPAYRRLTGR